MKESYKCSAMEIQVRHHNITLNYRNQDRIIQSELFKAAWHRANDDERKYALQLCNHPNSYELKRWILKILVGGLNQYPVNILRQIASYYQITNYSRMSKLQLLETLSKKGVTSDSKDGQRNN